jgi:carbamoyltransferase
LLEEILVKYVKFHLKKSNKSILVLVGGVHANVKANQRIAELPEVTKVLIYPAMSDAGLAAGAAWLMASLDFSPEHMPKNLSDVYLGPCFTDDEIEIELKNSKINFLKSNDIIADTAKLLADKKIVARFSGRMEYGPRSLGNRSILYTAEDATVNKWLNEKLQRTEFMPFAPMLRDIDAEKFLNSYDAKTATSAEFMTITFDVTKKCIEEAPAAVHVDNTARPQIVTETSNPDLYKILGAYKKLTGKSILVNTSFNMHEEPIVCTPLDAIRAFVSGNLDHLVIGSYICSQNNQANHN